MITTAIVLAIALVIVVGIAAMVAMAAIDAIVGLIVPIIIIVAIIIALSILGGVLLAIIKIIKHKMTCDALKAGNEEKKGGSTYGSRGSDNNRKCRKHKEAREDGENESEHVSDATTESILSKYGV